MSPKSLFIIILKIFGLFFLKDMVLELPRIAVMFSYISKATDSSAEGLLMAITNLTVLAFYGFIAFQLLFNANKILHKLKLNEGFDETELRFDLSTAHVIKIALIVIAGVILTIEVPNLCYQVFAYFQEKDLLHGMSKPDYSRIIISLVKCIIAFLLLGERKRIVDFIMERRAGE